MTAGERLTDEKARGQNMWEVITENSEFSVLIPNAGLKSAGFSLKAAFSRPVTTTRKTRGCDWGNLFIPIRAR
jgi:uncharacterized protein YgiM (DUF1202 family)